MKRLVFAFLFGFGCGSATSSTTGPAVAEAPGTVPPGAEAMSLLGKPLFPLTRDSQDRTRRKVALVEARAARRAQPNDPTLALVVGQRLTDLDRFRDAAQVFGEGLATQPDNAELLRQRGRARLALRDISGALADLAQAARTSNAFEVLVELGQAHFLASQWADAQAAFERAQGRADNDEQRIEADYWAAVAAARAAGVPALQRGQLEVKKNVAHLTLFRLEQNVLTAAEVEKMIGTPGQDPLLLHFGLGDFYSRQGDLGAARKHWQAALTHPDWSLPVYIAAEAELARLSKSSK